MSVAQDMRYDLDFATRILGLSPGDAAKWVASGYRHHTGCRLDGYPCAKCQRPTRNSQMVRRQGLPDGWVTRAGTGLCVACRWRGKRHRG